MSSHLPQSPLFPVTPTLETNGLLSYSQFSSYTGSNLHMMLYAQEGV